MDSIELICHQGFFEGRKTGGKLVKKQSKHKTKVTEVK
jgi:hypothetical protein